MYILCLNNGAVYSLNAKDMKAVECEAVALCTVANRGGMIHHDHTNNPQLAGIGWNGERYQMQTVHFHGD